MRKCDWDGSATIQRPGGDDEPFVYSGTLVVQGRRSWRSRGPGSTPRSGRSGGLCRRSKLEKTDAAEADQQAGAQPRDRRRLAKRLVVIAYGLTRGDWLHGFLAGVALAMAMLPEEFPVVLTIFLALGAWRISRKQVLTRRMPAIEILGSATVLCVDKTGTLTLNQMSVGQLYAHGKSLLLECTKPTTAGGLPLPLSSVSWQASEIPSIRWRRPFHCWGTSAWIRSEHIHGDWTLVQQYPLSTELLAISHVWQSTKGSDYVIAAKGAPEAIADLCHLVAGREANCREQVGDDGGRGLRVLAVAEGAACRQTDLPRRATRFDFTYLGLVGLVDPVGPRMSPMRSRNATARACGLMMITGDYPDHRANIARQIGLGSPGRHHHGALNSMRWATKIWPIAFVTSTSSPELCPSRSCVSLTRSKAMAKSSR